MENKKIINLTPHDVNIVGDDGKVILTLPKSENSLRVKASTQRVGVIIDSDSGIKVPLSESTFTEVDNLPPKKEGVIYIVSLLVCQYAPDRDDFYVVNEAVRDEHGRIIGCRSLSCNPYFRKKRGGDNQ